MIWDRVKYVLELWFRKSLAGFFVTAGLAVLKIQSWLSSILISWVDTNGSQFNAQVKGADVIDWQENVFFVLGIILIVLGCYFAWDASRKDRRKKILALELRGLEVATTSLLTAIPTIKIGQRIPILIDVRKEVDGIDEQKKDAVDKFNQIPFLIENHISGTSPIDVSIYAGGVASVPLLFLAGHLLGAESHIHWCEWDRKNLKWVSQKSGDDVEVISPTIIDTKPSEVVLAFSTSYLIDKEELSAAFTGQEIIEIKPKKPVVGAVVNDTSIQHLMDVFMNCLASLKGCGVKTVHLILAAPTIPSFRLGSSYDRRNMPELTIYQYQQHNAGNPYPWGIQMPNSESRRGKIVFR